jgi:4-hydroxybutyrate CoA-transferase
MAWQDICGARLREIDDVVARVRDGDTVILSVREPFGLALGLAARKEELKRVKIYTLAPSYDFGWYDEGWRDSFELTIGYPTAIARAGLDGGWIDVYPGAAFPSLAPYPYVTGEQSADFYFVEVSPPDGHGFCSFGVALWDKRRVAKTSKVVVAEVNETLISTYGENYIHESEIDFFVEHVPTGRVHGQSGSLAGHAAAGPAPYLDDIVANIAQFIEDGATLQIGVGRTTESLVRAGLLSGARELGFHSEVTVPGILTAAREGIVTGSRKRSYPGKLVATSIGGGSLDEIKWAQDNPRVELLEASRLMDIRLIAAEERFVAINNILSVDLTGQVAAESIGRTLVGQAGGQLLFIMGSWHSERGHSIQVTPSTASDGQVSRIVPSHPEGTVITTPRNVVDKIVTEYGVADLKGKSLRQRARALIDVAHPEHREALERAAYGLTND